MAKKTLEQKIDALTSIVEKGFATQDKEVQDLTESVEFVVTHMATKDDVRTIVREETKDIRTELASIRRDREAPWHREQARRLSSRQLSGKMLPGRSRDLHQCRHGDPYLLRGMEIERPNQVWAMDITYIPMARGLVYLAVVLDWFSRRVLTWQLSITMEASFCVETLQAALAKHGKPEIFNTDQGSQFTGTAFTGVLIENGITISMDGKGAWRDNVFVERLWRSVKYEEVYLRAYDGVSEARSSIGRYLDFYNRRRPHSSLDGATPDQAYFTPLPFRMAA